MIAYNLLINKINIPKYSIYEIDFSSKDEISQLSNSLTMKGNNINNVKNILRYLGKLEERIAFIPEINNIIADKYYKLLELDILSSNLCNVIKIFKNNRILRRFLYDNMKYIIDKNKICNKYNDYHISDFIFELAELKERFLARKVLEIHNILLPKSEAILSCILSCSRFTVRGILRSRGFL